MDGDPLHDAVPLEKQSSALSRQSTYRTTPDMAKRMTEQREAELTAEIGRLTDELAALRAELAEVRATAARREADLTAQVASRDDELAALRAELAEVRAAAAQHVAACLGRWHAVEHHGQH